MRNRTFLRATSACSVSACELTDTYSPAAIHGTCHQPGDAGEQHLTAPGIRCRHADDETGRGDDAVVRPEDGGAQPADPLGAVSLQMTASRHGPTRISAFLAVYDNFAGTGLIDECARGSGITCHSSTRDHYGLE